MRETLSRKFILTSVVIMSAFAICVMLGFKVFSEPSVKIIYLTTDQEKALKQVDTLLMNVQKQYESLQAQRGALATGFALSTDEVKAHGLEWEKEYAFIEDKEGHGFRLLTEAEKKAKAEAAQGK